MSLKKSLPLLITLAFFGGVVPVAAINGYPTASEYASEAPRGKFVPARRYKIGGRRMICGNRPTVLDPDFDSWGGSYPGFIIMNPEANRNLPRVVVKFIYAHECGHQFRGADEDTADAFAIRRGIRWGWLRNKKGMNAICRFISKIPADAVHPPGPVRCTRMRAYYNELMNKKRQTSSN